MEPTAEMRWWWPGPCPDEVVAWFAALPDALEEESRTDHYLSLPGHVATGIKARAGDQLDVKVRIGREEDVRVGDRVTGHLERWTKWQFPLATDGPGIEDLDGFPGSWVRASKYRWLVEVGACELEVGEVDVDGDVWWTIAAEATGEGDTGRDHVLSCLRWMVDHGMPDVVSLTPEASWGYPAHLRHVIDERT